VPRLRDPAVISGQKPIETLLREIEEEAATYPRARQEVLAVRCYLQRAISQCASYWLDITKGITNYLSLIREIERAFQPEPVCLVTFNYDTLLEDALHRVGFSITSIDDYTNNPSTYRLFKLHGSVGWAREVEVVPPFNIDIGDRPSVLRYLIGQGARVTISDRFVLCDPGSMGVTNGRPVFPAIAVPVEKKGSFECPRHMIEELTALLPRVTKILVIGWRATEDHFLDLLKKHLKRGVHLYVVAHGEADAEEIRVRINRALINNPPSSIADSAPGFTEFMRSRRAEQILSD
jgi:SIR2-like domain